MAQICEGMGGYPPARRSELNWHGRVKLWYRWYALQCHTAVAVNNKGKENERKSIYIATFILRIVSKRLGIDHTVLLVNTPCLPFLRKHSPDGATPNRCSKHLIADYYSFIDPEGMKG